MIKRNKICKHGEKKKSAKRVSHVEHLKRLFCTQSLTINQIHNRYEKLITEAKKGFPKNACFTKKWLKRVLFKIDELWYEGHLFPAAKKNFKRLRILPYLKDDVENAGMIADELYEDGSRTVDIIMNRDMFNSLFRHNEPGYHAAGLLCRDRLSCFIGIVTHESVHLFLLLLEMNNIVPPQSEHSGLFSEIRHHWFNQSDNKHGLIPKMYQRNSLSEVKQFLDENKNANVFIILDGQETSCKVIKRGYKRCQVRTTDDGIVFEVEYGLILLPQENSSVESEHGKILRH